MGRTVRPPRIHLLHWQRSLFSSVRILFLIVLLASGSLCAPSPPAAPLRQAAPPSRPPALSPEPETIQTNIQLVANPTLFSVLAAINVGGYHAGLNAPDSSPLRRRILKTILAKNLPIFGRLRQYYLIHRLADPAANLSQYISLAMFLGPPPMFRLQLPFNELPPDAQQLQHFPTLLRQFYRQADISPIWAQYAPAYQAAIHAYARPVQTVLNQVDDYLRLTQTYQGRQYYIYPEILASPLETHARSYLGNYFIIVNFHPASELHDIRHTYLHYVFDPLVRQYPGAIARILPLMPWLQKAPRLNPQFQHSPALFYVECWVRAVEARLDGKTRLAQQAIVRSDMAKGLILTQYFYQCLLHYDQGVANFSRYYPHAAYNVPMRSLINRLKHGKIHFAPAPKRIAPPPRPRSLLAQGDRLLQQGFLPDAAQLARTGLTKPDRDTRAQANYLLGEIAARQAHPRQAISHFQLALRQAGMFDTHVRTWANFYLARIYDLRGQRARALRHYRAALATAAAPDVRKLAREGIEHPFTAPRTAAKSAHNQ